jgi:hypothetical protein
VCLGSFAARPDRRRSSDRAALIGCPQNRAKFDSCRPIDGLSAVVSETSNRFDSLARWPGRVRAGFVLSRSIERSIRIVEPLHGCNRCPERALRSHRRQRCFCQPLTPKEKADERSIRLVSVVSPVGILDADWRSLAAPGPAGHLDTKSALVRRSFARWCARSAWARGRHPFASGFDDGIGRGWRTSQVSQTARNDLRSDPMPRNSSVLQALSGAPLLGSWSSPHPDVMATANDDFCKRIRNMCIAQCSDTSLPSGDYGFSFWNCVNKCMQKYGCSSVRG